MKTLSKLPVSDFDLEIFYHHKMTENLCCIDSCPVCLGYHEETETFTCLALVKKEALVNAKNKLEQRAEKSIKELDCRRNAINKVFDCMSKTLQDQLKEERSRIDKDITSLTGYFDLVKTIDKTLRQVASAEKFAEVAEQIQNDLFAFQTGFQYYDYLNTEYTDVSKLCGELVKKEESTEFQTDTEYPEPISVKEKVNLEQSSLGDPVTEIRDLSDEAKRLNNELVKAELLAAAWQSRQPELPAPLLI